MAPFWGRREASKERYNISIMFNYQVGHGGRARVPGSARPDTKPSRELGRPPSPRRGSGSVHLAEAHDDWPLALGRLLQRLVDGKPRRPVDLRELGRSPRTRRPFERECVAPERGHVEIALERPGSDRLAARLLVRAEVENAPSTAMPVSSRNSRFAASMRSSLSSARPLGIDQAPASFFAQNGPPGWTSRTSIPAGRLRKRRMPALIFAISLLAPRSPAQMTSNR